MGITDVLLMGQVQREQSITHARTRAAMYLSVDAALDRIDTLEAELQAARRELAEARGQLAVKTAQHVGVLAQCKAVKSELAKADPQNFLLAKAGGQYEGGAPRLNLNVVFEKAFDAHLDTYKFPHPSYRYRSVAK